VDAVRYRDPGRIAGFLAPDLVWDGVSPGLRCEGREQAAMAAADANTAHWR
jgi:hypothetical protein